MRLSLLIGLLMISSSIFELRAEELKIITPDEYITKNPTSERKDIVDFIIHQFDNQRSEVITQEKLDLYWKNPDEFSDRMRFQIINQKLYAEIDSRSYMETSYFPKMVKFLQKIVESYQINDVDFILLHQERITQDNNCPHFLMSKRDSLYERNKFLLPDFYIIDSWQELIAKLDKASQKYDWDNKVEKIFWRGLTTGDITKQPFSPRYNLTSFDKLPRLTIALFSKLFPELIDAKFSYYIGDLKHDDHQEFKKIMDELNLISYQYVNEEDHLRYKYLASIDGNTAAWKRVPWILASNSVLIKQETDVVQWFYPAIKPYVHYIPMNDNLTDIFVQLEWMKKNDSLVRNVSLKAQKFIKNDLMPENIQAHTVITLNEYHKLHGDRKITPTLPTAEEALEKAELKLANEKEMKKSRFVRYRNKIRRFFSEIAKSI